MPNITKDSIIEGEYLYYQDTPDRVFLYRLKDAEQVWVEVDSQGQCIIDSPLVPLPDEVVTRLRTMLNLV